jgi:hypothetical protein
MEIMLHAVMSAFVRVRAESGMQASVMRLSFAACIVAKI